MFLPGSLVVSACVAAFIAASPAQQAVFTDVTGASGIPALEYGEGVNFCDLDGDGLPELYLPNVKGKDRLYKNTGGFRFKDVTDASGIQVKGGIGAVVADLDRDGNPDIYVVRGAYPYGENVLYAGLEDGTAGAVFENISGAAGAGMKKNGISPVLGDFDGDGDLDIFVSNWGADSLYVNGSSPGRFSFSDEADKRGLGEEARTWGALSGDLDGDGMPDLYVCRGGFESEENPALYMNRGGVFVDVSEASGTNTVTWPMGAVSCDFDGDGDLDIFAASYDGPGRLYLNDGAGKFTDATDGSGIKASRSVGAAAGDIDGDLLPDLVVAGFAGPVRVFKNIGGAVFTDITKGSGVAAHRKNEGVALADADGDGDLDLYVANYDGHNRLYRNETGAGRFVKVRPVDGKAAAVGAKAALYKKRKKDKTGDKGAASTLVAYTELQAGYGFCSQSPMDAVFALPEGESFDLVVTFPGGATVTANDVKPGTLVIGRPDTANAP